MPGFIACSSFLCLVCSPPVARKDKQGGRKLGEQRSLRAEQEAEIRKLICDRTPDQLKIAFALWNRQAVRQLILERCGIALNPQGVGKYLARRGFTPQKPIKRAYEQRPEAVRYFQHPKLRYAA